MYRFPDEWELSLLKEIVAAGYRAVLSNHLLEGITDPTNNHWHWVVNYAYGVKQLMLQRCSTQSGLALPLLRERMWSAASAVTDTDAALLGFTSSM
ncbi:hypothetical protein Pelo_10385 [Pelomyxa schiedti]|nr:hypothetical protein Pelo_10385 [Pelomyxa schiedti]